MIYTNCITDFLKKKSKMFTDKQTDEQTDDEQQVIRKAHLNPGSGELKLPGLTLPG